MRKKPLVTGNRLTGWSVSDTPDAEIQELNSSPNSVQIIVKTNAEDGDHVQNPDFSAQIDSEDSNSGEKITKPSSPSSKRNHNEVEKNRRAKLRCCFEKLQEVVPAGPDVQKQTTQGLLIRAKNFIKTLERRQSRYATFKYQLTEEQKYLRRRLEQLQHVGSATSSNIPSTSIIPSSTVISSTSQSMNSVSTPTTPHILKRRQPHDPSSTTVASSSQQPTFNASFICCDNVAATQSVVGPDETEFMGAVESSNIHPTHILGNDSHHYTSLDPGLASHRVEMKFVDV